MQAQDIITRALRIAGWLKPGTTLPSGGTELTIGLQIFNGFLDFLNNQRLSIFAIERDTYTFVPGQQSYQIGPGAADFPNVPRPIKIDECSVLILNDETNPLELTMNNLTVDGWRNIPIKSVISTFPFAFYYDYSFQGTGFAVINFWPIPSQANQFILQTWTGLQQCPLLTTTVAYPPGYEDMLCYNLSVRLAMEWGIDLRPEVVAMAQATLARVKAFNIPSQDLHCDAALIADQKAYNWLTDNYLSHA